METEKSTRTKGSSYDLWLLTGMNQLSWRKIKQKLISSFFYESDHHAFKFRGVPLDQLDFVENAIKHIIFI